MIKEVIMYTVVCDNCGKDAFQDQEFSCWSEPGYATEIADEEGWYTDNIENVAYCDECWEYDDDDNVIISKPVIDDKFYELTSKCTIYYGGETLIFNTGTKFKLAGLELSKFGNNSPFHYNDDIIRLPNSIVKKIL